MRYPYRVAIIGTVIVFGVIYVIAFTTGVLTDLFAGVANEVMPKKVNSTHYEVESVDFRGESGFWSDDREVLFETESGLLVYPKIDVTYQLTDEGDKLSAEVVEYDKSSYDRVVLTVGKDHESKVQTGYANQFGENIKWKN